MCGAQMIPILLTPPAVEPISLTQAKIWLRIDHSHEDELISALIASARLVVESAARRMLVLQTWRIVMDQWPSADIIIPFAPVRRVLALRTLNDVDAGVVAPPSTYIAATSGGMRRRWLERRVPRSAGIVIAVASTGPMLVPLMATGQPFAANRCAGMAWAG